MGATLVVAAIIADDAGRILVNQRPPGRSHAGQWEFPGGKVEPGEEPRAALVRECAEELGCRVEVGAIHETIHHSYPDRDVLLLFYLARVVEGTPRACEGNTLAWGTPVELAAFDLLEADRPLPTAFARQFPAYRPGVLPS